MTGGIKLILVLFKAFATMDKDCIGFVHWVIMDMWQEREDCRTDIQCVLILHNFQSYGLKKFLL